MTDLKQMTVRALRELAREHLGAGYSRLKTKAELVAALSKVAGLEKAEKAADSAAKAPAKAAPAKPEAKAPAKPEPKVEARPDPKPAAKPEAKSKAEPKAKAEPKPKAGGKSKLDEIAAKYTERPAAPAPAVPAPIVAAPKAAALANPLEIAHPAPASPKAPGAGAPEPTQLAKAPAPAKAQPVAKAAPATAPAASAKKAALPREDDDQLEAPSDEDAEALEAADEAEASKESEASEEEAEVEAAPKPRRISPEEQALIDENLGELPFSYGEDTVNIQARDPSTLWVYWDLSVAAWEQAQGVRGAGRPVLRLYEANHLVREVEIALEAKSWYLYNIESGRRYRAEVDLVRGREVLHRLGPVSNTIQVPNEGPSPVIDDRFVTIPWEVPVQRAHDLVNRPHTGQPFPPAQAQALLQLAEQALRDEAKPAGPTPPGEAPVAGPGVTITERPVEGQGPQGERFVEVSVTRKLGASDTLTETFRRRLAGASEQVEANPRTRFGGRWTSSRPA